MYIVDYSISLRISVLQQSNSNFDYSEMTFFQDLVKRLIISIIVSWEWVDIAIIFPGHYNRNYCEMKSWLFIKSQ